MNMFKIRYSWGKTGNDNLGNNIRFPYLYTIATDGGGYKFADYGYDRSYSGMYYSQVASENVSWEIATKQDLGIDFSFLMINCQVLLIIIMKNVLVFIWGVLICQGLLV